MRWLAVALVAVLIVSLTWWKASTRHPELPLPTTSSELPPQTTGAARRNRAAAPGMAGSPLSDEETMRMDEAAHQAAGEQARTIVEAGRSKLFAQYQSESVDGGWALAREQSLSSHSTSQQIEDLKAKPKTLTVHCRSAICRINADFATRVAADDWLTLYLNNPGTDLWNASNQMTANPDGSVHLEIYGLARK